MILLLLKQQNSTTYVHCVRNNSNLIITMSLFFVFSFYCLQYRNVCTLQKTQKIAEVIPKGLCQKMPSNALNLRRYIVYVFEFLFWLVKPSFWQVFGDFVRIRLPVEHLTNCFDMFFTDIIIIKLLLLLTSRHRYHYSTILVIAVS